MRELASVVLTADALVSDGQHWGDLNPATTGGLDWYNDTPPHRAYAAIPAGGNQVFADGSAQWIKYQLMDCFNTFIGSSGTRYLFWYQDQSDFADKTPAINSIDLRNLSAQNYMK